MRFLSTLVASALGTLLALGAIIVFLVLFVFALSMAASPEPTVQDNSVLVVDVRGAIPERQADDPFAQLQTTRPAYDLVDLKGALNKAAADDRIEAVWLRIRSAPPTWATLEEAREALVDFKEESDKPIFASSQDFGMSEQEYFLASTADHIFATAQSPFEFNGFHTTLAFFRQGLDRLGVEPEVIRAGEFKSAVEPFTRDDMSEENRLQFTELLETQNAQFMNAVAESRGLEVEALNRKATESVILTVEDALEADLVDELKYRDEVTDRIKEEIGLGENESFSRVNVSQYARVPAADVGLEPVDDGVVGVVYADGAIVTGESGQGPNPLGGGSSVGSETFSDAMETARNDNRIETVVVRINSPGGMVSASEAMWREVMLTKEEKPVVVSMGDTAASGGYYVAAAADSIVADPLTITGSIGVYSILFDASELFEDRLGVTFDAVRTSPFADLYSGVRSLSDEERRLLEANTEQTYDAFLQRVADGRDMDIDAVREIAGGRVWSGADAQEVGLVDELGSLERAIEVAAEMADMEEGPYNVRRLPRPKTFIEQLNEMLNMQASKLWQRAMLSTHERKLLEHQRVLRDLARDHGTVQARLPYDITIE